MTNAAVKYVNVNAVGLNNGTSWANAYTSLHVALVTAASGDEIWIAQGVYKPTSYPIGCTGCSSGRDYAFTLKPNIKLFGGFSGIANETDISQRNYHLYPTILSGDLDDNGAISAGDAYHVIISINDNGVLLDGLTITNGNSNSGGSVTVEGRSITQNIGGGVYFYGANSTIDATFQNCIIDQNSATVGGGVSRVGGAMDFVNSLISNNLGTHSGIYCFIGTVDIRSCTFYGNASAIFEHSTSTTFTVYNSIFYGNTSQVLSGGGTVDMYYCILQNTFNVVNVTGNVIGVNPYFTDPDNGDFKLTSCSPAIGTGSTGYLSVDDFDLDQDGNIFERIPFDLGNGERIYPVASVDKGAYEYQGASTSSFINNKSVFSCDVPTTINGINYSESGVVSYFANNTGTGCVDTTYTIELTIGNCKTSSACDLNKALAFDGAINDYFGREVDVFGDVAIIGAYLDDLGSLTNAGSAYIYRKVGGGWAHETKLTAFDAAISDQFGQGVAISGNVAVVGATGDDPVANSGSAYVYRYNGSWNFEQKLEPPDAEANMFFGEKIDISANKLIISARLDDVSSTDEGSAYIYNYNGTSWELEQKLLPTNGLANDYFGHSVAIDGNIAVVGAIGVDDNGSLSGSAYVFRYNGGTWVQEQQLLASDGNANDRFGNDVDISGDAIVIGAFTDDNIAGSQTGSAYIFRYNGSSWVQEQKLNSSTPIINNNFGSSVGISGDRVLIGESFGDIAGANFGNAFLFEYNGGSWTEIQSLSAFDGANSDLFGYACAISGNEIVVGAYLEDGAGTSSGAAYFYEIATDQFNTQIVDACDSVQINGVWYNETQLVYDTISLACGDSILMTELTISNCSATEYCMYQKITASDGNAGDNFGNQVSVFGNRAIVGSYRDSDAGQWRGAAYIYEYNGSAWVQDQKLTASDGVDQDFFGVNVDISGDIAVIGAYYDDNLGANSGSAYVFEHDGSNWVETDILYGSDIESNDWSGRSVAVSGNMIAVGTPNDDDAANNAGAVYIFQKTNGSWTETQKIVPPGAPNLALFGYGVSIAGDWMIVGAYYEQTGTGAAYIYKWDGTEWAFDQKILASDGATQDYFGFEVDIADDVAIVGAYLNDDDGSGSGSAYIFRYNGSNWIQETKLTASDAAADDRFGEGVSISGDLAIVGARLNDDIFSNSGSAYLFQYDGVSSWSEIEKFNSPDPGTANVFGSDVNISGNTIIVGSYSDDDQGDNAGAAYFFDLTNTIIVPQVINACDSTLINGVWYSETQTISDTFSTSNGCSDSITIVDIEISSCSDCPTQEIQKVTSSSPNSSQQFGLGVDIKGELAIVAAPVDDDNGSASGAAHIFRYDGSSWIDEQKINASDGGSTDRFSDNGAVAIAGDWAVVGARLKDSGGYANNGHVYVFKYDGVNWNEHQILTGSSSTTNDQFGESVAISGGFIVVGETFGEISAGNSGIINIFEFDGTNWVEKQIIEASDAVANQYFGGYVDISGDRIVVSARSDNGNRGACYVYKFDGQNFVEEQKLVASDGAVGDRFGIEVGISDDVIVVGADLDDNNGFTNSGSAYVYRFNGSTWIQEQKLTASDEAGADQYGFSVDISYDKLVVSSGFADGTQGSLYKYRYNGSSWTNEEKIVASDGVSSDYFGIRSAISGDWIISGAYFDDDNGFNASGSAYFFNDLPQDKYYPIAVSACGDTMLNGISYIQSQVIMDTFPSFNGCGDSIVVTEVQISDCSIESYCEFQKETPGDALSGDAVGYGVSVFDDWAVVGAYRDDNANGTDAGAAYFYNYDGTIWNEIQKVIPADAFANDDLFGAEVDISGNYAIIGGNRNDENGSQSGAAWIYGYDGSSWILYQKLLASDGALNDRFGDGVAISGNFAVVGAAYANVGANSAAGAAYVYYFNGTTWEESQIITASDAASSDHFGWGISLFGSLLAISASDDDNANGTSAGAVYIFEYDGSTWNEVQKIITPDGTGQDYFGTEVVILEDYLFASSINNDNANGSNAGAVYVYERSGATYGLAQKLLASDGAAEDWFGHQIDATNDILVVGTRQNDDQGTNSGSTYLFKNNGSSWVEMDNFLASDGSANTYFGHDVAVSDNHIVIGRYGDIASSGSVYFFEPKLDPITFEQNVLSCDSADLNGSTYYTSQTIIDTFSVSNCQDSIVTTNLTIQDGSVSITCPSDTTVQEFGYGCSATLVLPAPDVVLGECLENTGLNFD
ncbi:MAG: hypothetical protein KDD32_00920, partial [Bacteroidetes bacterium]|nr:hypothetical protein [Bacteroidota bacterium]